MFMLFLFPYVDAGLREHINTILGSDYITATPEVKPSVDLAAEVGYGTAQAQMNEMYENAPVANAPGLSEHYKQNYEVCRFFLKDFGTHIKKMYVI